MRAILLCTLLAYLYSCNNKNNSEQVGEKQQTEEKQDQKKEIQYLFTENNFKKLQLPLKADTNFVDNADTNDSLSYHDIRSERAQLFKDGDDEGLSTFCHIDSLKEKKLYQAYLDSLDIGMTRNSTAFKAGYIELKNGGKLFLWGMESSNLEACPVFSVKSIIATYISAKGEIIESFLLAERSSGADPPLVGTEDVAAVIDAEGNIRQIMTRINDDLDVPGNEITIVTSEIKLTDNTVEKKELKKEEKITEVRTEDN